jgi:hypothetical protein
MKRQADGTFADADLANILHTASVILLYSLLIWSKTTGVFRTEHPAGAFRARGTPGTLSLDPLYLLSNMVDSIYEAP